MRNEPLVSILIPAYNAERTLAWTIESALAQSWPHKEIIVVDDGSSDTTLEVAGKYWAEPGVRVISQPNRGASNARNLALSAARGEYIQWLDADDLLHPDMIRLQMESQAQGLAPKNLVTAAWGSFYYCVSRAWYRPDGLWETLGPIEWLLRNFSSNLWMNPACPPKTGRRSGW
jgi:glycosyltransferase involved in cell wall biosynthesis